MGGAITIVFATSNECYSVEQIYRNIDICDEQNVILTGKVVGLTFSTSDASNNYTTFMLDDSTAQPLKVFSFTRLSIQNGDIVKIRGKFFKNYVYKNKSFGIEIITTPEEVSVIQKSLIDKLLPIAMMVIFLIVAVFLLYRKYKQPKVSKNDNRKYKQSKISKESKYEISTEYEIGVAFENHVQSLFDTKDWSMVNYTKDMFKNFGRKVESDSDPDFIMRHKDTNKIIAIECKYRSSFLQGYRHYGTVWAQEYQIKNYNEFQKKTNYSVFIVIGIVGLPSAPERIFLVPLYCLKYEFVSEEYLKKFERNPKNNFMIEEFKKLDRNV